MKIATYNIQNIFFRHIDLFERNYKKKFELWQGEFETLLLKEKRKNSDYQRMRELAELLGLHSLKRKMYSSYTSNSEHHYNPIEHGNMISISEEALKHKVKVVSEVDPDVILLQEVESRAALLKFNELVFKSTPETAFKEFIHLDGNSCNGLGMGIMLKDGYRIRAIKSFSSEMDEDGSFLFSNDLQLYKIENPIGKFIYVLCVQLSSDSEYESNHIKRKRQAKLVSEVYKELRQHGNENIIVLGTLNAPKYSKSISPIMDTDMINITEFPNFEVEPDFGSDKGYYRLGAYKKGVNIEQSDYLLTSPLMRNRILKGGMNRKAIWSLSRPQWPTYKSLKKEMDSASDHPLLWIEINLETSEVYLRKTA